MNANVEFDTGSLMPTYRLLWGEAGQSQALAVAEGLGFDPDIVAAARQIAASAHLTASRSGEALLIGTIRQKWTLVVKTL